MKFLLATIAHLQFDCGRALFGNHPAVTVAAIIFDCCFHVTNVRTLFKIKNIFLQHYFNYLIFNRIIFYLKKCFVFHVT